MNTSHVQYNNPIVSKTQLKTLTDDQVMEKVVNPALISIGGSALVENFKRLKKRVHHPLRDLRSLVLNNFNYCPFNDEKVEDLAKVLKYINHLVQLKTKQ